MKRIISFLLIILLSFTLVSCESADDEATAKSTDKILIACTTFAAYDWARAVAGDRNVEVVLVGGGADLHSYDPTADDILTVSQCSLLIHTGGESDAWVNDAQRMIGSHTINMIEAIGSQVYYVHSHGDETDTPDEHIWMSLNNAHIIAKEISDVLSELDNDGYLDYDDNREQLSLKLNALDAEYRAAVAQYKLPSVIVADRFGLAYMLRDYGIAWYAAFSGCSTDVNASFATITQMAEVVDRLSAGHIIVTEDSTAGIAQAVIDSTNAKTCKTVVIDTMQSATEKDSYVDIMTKNLELLKLAIVEDTE